MARRAFAGRTYATRARYAEASFASQPDAGEPVTTLDELGIVVTRTSFARTTRYRITGMPDLVRGQVEYIKDRYPSAAYGTWVCPPSFVSQGIVEVIVDRSNSCD